MDYALENIPRYKLYAVFYEYEYEYEYSEETQSVKITIHPKHTAMGEVQYSAVIDIKSP